MAERPIWEQIGTSFVQLYYQQFDNSREQLGALYVSINIVVSLIQQTDIAEGSRLGVLLKTKWPHLELSVCFCQKENHHLQFAIWVHLQFAIWVQ